MLTLNLTYVANSLRVVLNVCPEWNFCRFVFDEQCKQCRVESESCTAQSTHTHTHTHTHTCSSSGRHALSRAVCYMNFSNASSRDSRLSAFFRMSRGLERYRLVDKVYKDRRKLTQQNKRARDNYCKQIARQHSWLTV